MKNEKIYMLVLVLLIYSCISNIISGTVRSSINRRVREIDKKIELIDKKLNEQNQPAATIDAQGSEILERITIA